MSFVIAGNSASTGYNLTRSIRTRASASAYLNRTPATTTNRQTWTWSGWVKRGTLTGDQAIFFAGTAGNNNTLRFNSDNTMYVFRYDGAITWGLSTTQVFRDPSAWYHVVVAYDSTQATSTNRVKLYINGTQVTAFSSATYPSLNLNSDVNNTVVHRIANNDASNNFDGYQTEDNLVDGQALTPSSFGSTNALTGVWQPARYTGTYGTNGFYLPFTDNSALTTASNVGLGKDFSGNGNYWTTNNISITAGVTYDSMTDVPTLTSATAANFPTLNPLAGTSGTISNANLTLVGASAGATQRVSTIAASSGKIYFECQADWDGAQKTSAIGIARTTGDVNAVTSQFSGQASDAYALFIGGGGSNFTYNNSITTTWGATPASPVIMQVAVDLTNLKVWFGVNNTWVQGDPSAGTDQVYTILAGTYLLTARQSGGPTSSTLNVNFGQRPFAYTPPTGFVSLNTFNLPDSTIKKGNSVMDATLWSGTSASNAITNAAAFKPDFVWIKSRSNAISHGLFDSVRGTNKTLYSNLTAAEDTYTDTLNSFNTNGFTLGSDATWGGVNVSGRTYVGWQWQAGQGSSSSNTNGTITSTVSVNASAGFSVVTYTGTGSTGTVGHGLGVAPQFIIVKSRTSGVEQWYIYHQALGNTKYLYFLTDAAYTINAWNNTSPTSSVFSLSSLNGVNQSANTFVAYCWTPIAGFSAFGSYTGNGSTDGTFVYTGFRPRFILYKPTNVAGTDWVMWDTARTQYNVLGNYLLANTSGAEGTATVIDILSNGFKMRTASTGNNGSGDNIVYAAFAENPFKNSLAR
jgi:hypothetical protein